MKTYVITLSKKFPMTHKQAGQPTHFGGAFFKGQGENINLDNWRTKLHTIRANYPLWEKRMKEIQEGRACLSVRMWGGKPYRSKQEELARLTKDDGIGIQKLNFYKFPELSLIDGLATGNISAKLAENDGLTFEDWYDWFRSYDLTHPMAIIHFTKFRY